MKPVLSISLILIGGLVFYFLTMPLLNMVTTLQNQIAGLDEVLNNGRQLIQVRDQRKNDLIRFPEDIRGRLEKMVPDHIDNVRLIIDLIALAKRYGIELHNPQIVAPGTKTAATGPNVNRYDSVQLNFSITASYDVFQKFLEDMERSLRLTDVVSVGFTAGDKDTYDYTITIRTYWLK